MLGSRLQSLNFYVSLVIVFNSYSVATVCPGQTQCLSTTGSGCHDVKSMSNGSVTGRRASKCASCRCVTTVTNVDTANGSTKYGCSGTLLQRWPRAGMLKLCHRDWHFFLVFTKNIYLLDFVHSLVNTKQWCKMMRFHQLKQLNHCHSNENWVWFVVHRFGKTRSASIKKALQKKRESDSQKRTLHQG